MRFDGPFHSGEVAVQELAGEREIAARTGRILSRDLAPGAQSFIADQQMVVVGSVEPEGRTWASVIFGGRGFASADTDTVALDLQRAGHERTDPLWANAEPGRQVGMLFIDLAKRRRLRVNGLIQTRSEARLEVTVSEAYPNCPKHIHPRDIASVLSASRKAPAKTHEGVELTSAALRMIETADTFFVASSHRERGVDASHRGGPPGFVKALDRRTLRVPDFAGNSMFNTLGNIAVNPHAGLIFIDFASGSVLQLAGRGEVRFDASDSMGGPGGTERFWDFTADKWRFLEREASGVAP